ncbi:MAG TPA: rhodanese-like domain-containing protein [Thermoanaerobaculia bacterium]
MSKKKHPEKAASSNKTLALLAVGAVVVAALLIWALTRDVEPAATAVFDPVPSAEAPVVAPTSTEPFATPPATQTSPAAPQESRGDEASVPRISAEDLRAKMNRGEVVVVDVRDARGYELGHIPGAIHAAFANIEGSVERLPRDKPIVTYCT